MTGLYKTFHEGIKDLYTKYKITIDRKKKYQIFTCHTSLFGHRAIVIRGGENETIIFGMQVNVDNTSDAVTGQGNTLAEVKLYSDKGKCTTKWGEVTSSLCDLAKIADSIFQSEPQYN